MDEILDYLFTVFAVKVGDKTLAELTVNFLLNLMAVVSSTGKSQLLITLTGEQALYEKESKEVRKIIDDTQRSKLFQMVREASSRQGRYIVPVERDDIYDIVKSRLIQKATINEAAREDVVETYSEYYGRKSLVTDPLYKDKMKKAYPFHPALIDILYSRVSTIREFNKTRGILRILALTLKMCS